ncbi:hypothetical protein CC1G_06808 [Coprinopsis cinerea okayama7|uniref:Microbial-type PARG catalytic domain-containing protein n=1 Tax=Coprinopsis cinerea (strain Okayama-7 / 130 / ATCC MYA-4618 / FGSC 9003) TaxID=240176 RepID=A8N1J9_COPC7|nr:hypothetical protein CC1G_06808 [Coprinopsis cinerea okayama7\|eukprot:XP_001828822.1 hypothetical protein CC1G_06808 [Coprinopsis cinerea okayama7\
MARNDPGPDGRVHRTRIADQTIEVVRKQQIWDRVNRRTYDLKPSLEYMLKKTTVYMPDDFGSSFYSPSGSSSSLRWLALSTAGVKRDMPGGIGVLNFASATKPGGGWRNGARAQEESIARSSTLWKSLEGSNAQPFYELHKSIEASWANAARGGGRIGIGKGPGWYTNAMVWSPRVVVFKNDDGNLVREIEVDVVTSCAVNAKVVSSQAGNSAATWYSHNQPIPQPHPGYSFPTWSPHYSHPQRLPPQQAVDLNGLLYIAMKHRMTRILALFESKGTTNLVLGAFGTGVFGNDVQMVVQIWRELLLDRDARFRWSFENVVFAVRDERTLDIFRRGFGDYGQGSRGGGGRAVTRPGRG